MNLSALAGNQRIKAQLSQQETALCSMWEGQAKDTFHQAFIRDKQQMDIFYQLIAQYIQALLEIAERYERAEARNREIAASYRTGWSTCEILVQSCLYMDSFASLVYI